MYVWNKVSFENSSYRILFETTLRVWDFVLDIAFLYQVFDFLFFQVGEFITNTRFSGKKWGSNRVESEIGGNVVHLHFHNSAYRNTYTPTRTQRQDIVIFYILSVVYNNPGASRLRISLRRGKYRDYCQRRSV